jgi:Zn-dependent protease with chaperone function
MERFWLAILVFVPALGLLFANFEIAQLNDRLLDEEFDEHSDTWTAKLENGVVRLDWTVEPARAARRALREYECMENRDFPRVVRGGPTNPRECQPRSKRFLPTLSTDAALIEELKVERRCALASAQDSQICRDYVPVRRVKSASLWAWVIPLALGLLIKIAARVARNDRKRLLLLFEPGLQVTALALGGLSLLHAGIWIGMLYFLTGGHVLNGVMNYMLMFGAIAAGGCLLMMWHIFGWLFVQRRPAMTALGVPVPRKKAPRLWAAIDETAQRLGCRSPEHVVVGLDTNFYATEADLTCCGGTVTGLTLYCSLPLARILSRLEFQAVLAHELGHYRGEDLRYSERFLPIYRGARDSIRSLQFPLYGWVAIGRITIIPAQVGLEFFLSEFSVAEREVSRARELAADQAGASASGEEVMASALVKIHAFADLWFDQEEAAVRYLRQGHYLNNPSKRFAEAVEACADDDALEGAGQLAFRHPLDSHPPLTYRLGALGISLEEVSSRALDVAPLDPAIALFDDPERFEMELGKIHHRSLATQRGIGLVHT